VRLSAKEQVESLGAKFVMVEDEEAQQAETEGGYAKEMSEAYKQKQAELIAETLKKQDIVITTALIPGKPAPELISKEMVADMKPGAVIADLAVEQGGNCALSQPGEVVESGGVEILGYTNVASRVATDASMLLAKNLLNYLSPLIDTESGTLSLDDQGDEVVKHSLVTKDGAIVQPGLAEAAE